MECLIGTIFHFEENFEAESYSDLSRYLLILILAIAVIFLNELDPEMCNARLWFQHDGTPSHFGVNVWKHINQLLQVAGLDDEVQSNRHKDTRINTST